MIEAMRNLLSGDDESRLKRIYAPVWVGTPPTDARCGLCVMPDGEIRCYGFENKRNIHDFSNGVYLASRDCGLSWKLHSHDGTGMCAAVRSPYSGRYVNVVATRAAETGFAPDRLPAETGVYALLGDSPDDPNYRVVKITDEPISGMYPVVPLRDRQRLLCAAHLVRDGYYRPVVLRSDDDGESWSVSVLDSAPRHEIRWPHKGLRWQNDSAEPTLAQMPDGSVYLLARTSLDVFYAYRSQDGGESWTPGEPSDFHATLTNPCLFSLSDGRVMLFWCNTQPLPELDHARQFPPLRPGEISGEEGEDVFTNRDANHAAILSDGEWRGFREVFLNTLRNEADFRSRGGNADSLDKSVHQFQALELPYGKILLTFGQHPLSRGMVIFDPAWLLERGRREDFLLGLTGISTHVYLNSVSGNYRGLSGHCAWNRTNGAVLMPDPDGNFREALFLSRVHDPRLLSETQGAAWNFPAAHRGEIRLKLRMPGQGLRLSLLDRWMNPIDWTVWHSARFSLVVTGDMLTGDGWNDVLLRWDESGAEFFVGDRFIIRLLPTAAAPHGLSYLHLQTTAQGEDEKGAYVAELAFKTI